MSLLGILDIGKSALFASQAALNVTSNNIANVNTPGYSKEGVILSIANPVSSNGSMIGMGVTVSSIERSYDRFIQAQLLDQGQSQGRSAAMDNAWGQIESVFNDAQGTGLSSSLLDYFNAWQDVANDPTDQTPRTTLLQKAGTLTSNAKSMEQSILATLKSANDGISDAVSSVNSLATDIAKLNGQITLQEAGSAQSANELRDQRDEKLAELAQLTDFSSYEDNNGSLTITVGMRNLVSGTRTNTLSAATTSDGVENLFLDGINITSNVQKGQIGGLLGAQSDIQNTALTGLRKLVASITQQVNQLHETGVGLDGSTGNDFFAPLQLSTSTNSAGASVTAASITNQSLLTLDEYTVTFDTGGGTYSVLNKQTGAVVTPATAYNAAGTTIALPGISVTIAGPVTNSDTVTISPLANAVGNFSVAISDPQQVAASSTAAGLPGNNDTALQIAQLADSTQTALGNTDFSGYYSSIVSTVGVMKSTTADGLTFDNNLMSALSAKRDSVSGVSLDEEAANLVRYQRSYEASARMVSVADELMQTILNIS